MEPNKRFDARAGDPERQKRAAERAEAIRNGTLPEYEAKLAAEKENAANPGGIPVHMIPESIETRNERIMEGRPEAPFLKDALHHKLKNPGDPRSIEELAAALERGESIEEAA